MCPSIFQIKIKFKKTHANEFKLTKNRILKNKLILVPKTTEIQRQLFHNTHYHELPQQLPGTLLGRGVKIPWSYFQTE